MLKPLTISMPGGSGTVGEEGSLWADPQSLDLIRLESHAVEIPPYLPLQEASSNVNYARMRIGAHDVLMAQQADSHMLNAAGVEDYNRLEFTHCRAYSVQSNILFDPEPQEPAQILPSKSSPIPSSMDADGQAVPALLLITVQLTTPISDKDAVGTLIEGKVSNDVLRKGKILIPKAPWSGGELDVSSDIRRAAEPSSWDLSLRNGSARRIAVYADVLRIDKNPRIQLTRSERVFVHGSAGIQTRERNRHSAGAARSGFVLRQRQHLYTSERFPHDLEDTRAHSVRLTTTSDYGALLP